MENRSYPRTNLSIEIVYAIINKGQSTNISKGGLCMITDRLLKKNRDMTLLFSLSNGTKRDIKTFGRVMWIKEIDSKTYENGIEFWDIDLVYKKKIENYINSQLIPAK